MKNYEVFIIVVVIAGIGLYWWKDIFNNAQGAPVQQPIPVGSAIPISFSGPGCEVP